MDDTNTTGQTGLTGEQGADSATTGEPEVKVAPETDGVEQVAAPVEKVGAKEPPIAKKEKTIEERVEESVKKTVSKMQSTMQKTFETKLSESRGEVQNLSSELQLAVDVILASGIEPEAGTPAADLLAKYRKKVADNATERATAEKTRQSTEALHAFVTQLATETTEALTEAGIDPESDEVNAVLSPLMEKGQYNKVWPAVTKIIAGKAKPSPDVLKEADKQFRKKYKIDLQDLGSGAGKSNATDLTGKSTDDLFGMAYAPKK
jgi:hypothetical protein